MNLKVRNKTYFLCLLFSLCFVFLLLKKAMSAKPKNFKRCIFTESDCHKLVDIVTNYKNIVECKKSDAVTWKQKAAGWEKIAELYNSTTTERRTADQLRCKFDNLKKDVRKYEAQKTQNMLRTGGKIEEVDINEAMKLLYAKVKGIIGLPVKSLEPSIGDSDDVFSTGTDSNSVEPYINNMQILYEAEASSQAVKLEEDSSSIDVFVNNMEELQETDNIPSTSQVVKLEEDFGGSSGEEVKEVDYQISDTPAQEHGKEVVEKNDWLDYTGKKLQPRKHTALKTKRKRSDSINTKEQQIILKMELLEEEAARNKEYHGERMKREQEVHILKSKNLVLQNEKLELEIQLLKKQLGTP